MEDSETVAALSSSFIFYAQFSRSGSLLGQVGEGLEQLPLVQEVAEVVEEPFGRAGAEQVHDLPLAVEQRVALAAKAIDLAAQLAELGGRVGDLARRWLRFEM